MTVDKLISHFAEICIKQDQHLLYDEIDEVNKLNKMLRAVDMELRAQGNEARLALLKLYDHPNIQVRLKAAKLSLGVAPVEARALIQEIYDSQWMPQSLDAGMTLRALDEEIFKPD